LRGKKKDKKRGITQAWKPGFIFLGKKVSGGREMLRTKEQPRMERQMRSEGFSAGGKFEPGKRGGRKNVGSSAGVWGGVELCGEVDHRGVLINITQICAGVKRKVPWGASANSVHSKSKIQTFQGQWKQKGCAGKLVLHMAVWQNRLTEVG